MAEESAVADQERLLQRVQELEEEVKRLQAKLREDKEGAGRREVPPAAGKAKKRQQRPFDFGAYGRRHVALKIAYLGWSYQGFASQENTSNTVEEKLFEALKKTRLVDDRQTSNYHRCGRTDKGVSAFGQVRIPPIPASQGVTGSDLVFKKPLDPKAGPAMASCVRNDDVSPSKCLLLLGFGVFFHPEACLERMKRVSGCSFANSSALPKKKKGGEMPLP